MLKRFANSGNTDLQTIGVAASLERQVPDALQDLDRLLSNIVTNRYKSYVVSALKIRWRKSEAGDVKSLAALAERTSDAQMRAAAIWALAAMHTKETLPALARLLSSNEPQDQTQAMYGLSAFANGCPVKTVDNAVSMAYLQCDASSAYKSVQTKAMLVFSEGSAEQRATAVNFWKAWWAEHPELH